MEKKKTKVRVQVFCLSYMITVSAVAGFIPKPPALFESRKQNLEEFLALNPSIFICLSAPQGFGRFRERKEYQLNKVLRPTPISLPAKGIEAQITKGSYCKDNGKEFDLGGT